MMKQHIITLAMMTAAFVVVRAMPAAVTTESGLFLRAVDGPTSIFLSTVTDTIFGQDTDNYDYIVHSDSDRAIEASHQFADAWVSGNQHDILVAFRNATRQGYLTSEQASDKEWLCNELYSSMRSHVEECSGIEKRDTTGTIDIEARSRWNWIRSGSHVATQFGFNVLAGVLGNAAYANLPTSPRSICDQGACISWSKIETFNGYFAQAMVDDGLSAVDLNRYSAQANGILGSRKRSGADVCLSNRPKGCT
jgi:hypothetical protein